MMAELRRCKKTKQNKKYYFYYDNFFVAWCMSFENVKRIMTHSLVFNDDVECLLGDHGRVTLVQWVHIVVQVVHHIFKKKNKK